MKVVLVRHGEAESLRSSDAERALTEHGVTQARQTGAWLRQETEEPSAMRLVASPFRRAQETAAVLKEFLQVPVATVAEIHPDGDPRAALAALMEIAGECDCLVVVSHMPLVAALALWMEEGVLGTGQGFSLAEARILETEALGPGAARLRKRFIPGLSL